MQKIIRVGNKITVVLNNGSIIEKELSIESQKRILDAKSDEEVLKIMSPEYLRDKEKVDKVVSLLDKVKKSKILRLKNNIIYWDKVSTLSIPEELAEVVLKAEEDKDELKLTTYKNFWTLMSLNPNEECRRDLFKFLTIYGMTIAKCGFFVGYRNVDTTSEEGVYTDHHSHTFKIKIGEMVVMPRENCDNDSKVTCSRGLHIAGKGWLKRNYFGDTGLACLVNPVDVVAVPQVENNYGKLRTCAYLPMATIEYDKFDDVIPLDIEDGFDCSYVSKVIYEGILGTEQDSPYKIVVPNNPIYVKESIQDELLEIAKECIINKKL